MVGQVHYLACLQRVGVLRDMRLHAQKIAPLRVIASNKRHVFGLFPAIHLLVPNVLDAEARVKDDWACGTKRISH